MNEMLQEFVNCQGVDVRVDAGRGVIRGVKLLGIASRNGRRYLPTALGDAAALYDGAKVNVNHPKGSPLAARDYQDRLGSIRNVRAAGDGLYGDLHYNPKHALAEQLAWDAVHAPENVGFSHNVEARTSRVGGQTVVEAIIKVQSVDLVADPATTRSLYESEAAGVPAVSPAGAAWQDLTLAELSAARPDLVESIRADAAGQVAALREELDRLEARDALRGRREQAAALLAEYGLPAAQAADRTSRSIVSESFLASLLEATDEATMRRLVAERAAMVAAARQLESGVAARTAKPVAREQHLLEGAPRPLDAAAFAQAIS